MLNREIKRDDDRSANDREKSAKFGATYPGNNAKKEPQSQINNKSTTINQTLQKTNAYNSQNNFKVMQNQIKTEVTTQNNKKSSKFSHLQSDEDDDEDNILANCDFIAIEKNACSPAVANIRNNNIKRHQSDDLISKYQDNGKKYKSEMVQDSDDEDVYLMQNIVEPLKPSVNINNKAVVRPLIQKTEVKNAPVIANFDDEDDDDFNNFLGTGKV